MGKPGKHYLKQVIRINVGGDTALWCQTFRCPVMTRAFTSVTFFSKPHSNYNGIIRQTNVEEPSPVLLKRVKVVKNKDSLSYCRSQEEPTDIRKLNVCVQHEILKQGEGC